MPNLVVTLEFSDESDMDYFRHRIVGQIEEMVDEIKTTEASRVDGEIEVSWEVDFGDD